MVAFRHLSVISPLTIVLVILDLWRPASGQVGLKTLPLTASRNRSANLGLFSKWTEGASSNPSENEPPSIEIELAAILRDIAYGISTEPTTSTSTSTTTQRPITSKSFQNSYNPVGIQPPSSKPVSPPWDNNVWNEHSGRKNGARPVQHQYVESPVIEPSDNYDIGKPYEETMEDTGPGVWISDIGSKEPGWLVSLGVLWEIHVYIAAGLFSIVVLLSLYSFTRVHLSTQLLPRGYYITVHLLVFLAAFFRCVYFFHDPYAAAKLLPNSLSNILFNTGTPCIITALAVLILALLKIARLEILPLNLQSPVVVGVISGSLIAGSIIIDAFGGMFKEQQVVPGLKGVMQALTAGWGAALCIGYIIIFVRVEKAAKRLQNEIVRITFSRLQLEGSSLPRRLPESPLKISGRLTLAASTAGLVLAALQVYGLINSDLVINLPPSNSWVWIAFQSSCRILEIVLWSCISIASALPANFNRNERNKTAKGRGQLLTVLSCKNCTVCSNLSSCIYKKNSSDDMYSTICQTNHVARNFSIHSDRKLIPQDTIASTGLPPKHISTTLLPPKTRKSLNKTSTLHSAGSDAQLLWNNSNANSSNSSSRPSSLILTEGGLIKFRTHEPHNEIVRVINYPKKDYDPKTDLHEAHKNILECCGTPGEDNYINSGALTPEEKRAIEKNIQASKMQHRLASESNNDLYTDIEQQNIPYSRAGNTPKEPYSPLHIPCKYTNNSAPSNENNSFDVRFYEDCDIGYYQSPSIDSSVESSGHIYASIQQPITQPSQEKRDEHSHEKILNSSNFMFQIPFQTRRSSSSCSQPHHDIIQTDYLTDASQDPVESPGSESRFIFTGPHAYLQGNSQVYQQQGESISPIQNYRNYSPVPLTRESHDCFYNSIDNTDHFRHCPGDRGYRNGDHDVGPGCPISPSQRKRFLGKASSSNFENVSYTPLQGDDDQYPESKEKIRPCGHRPRMVKLSAHSFDSSKHFNIDSKQSQNVSNDEIKANFEKARNEGRTDISNPHLFQKEGEKLNQRLRDLSPNETISQIDFPPLKAHKFPSEGVSWTDQKASPKIPSDPLSQKTSLDSSDLDVHPECIETNGETTQKSMEIRWPLNCKEETGV